MNADVMILLVGEQPAPNVLPLRHYNPAQVALVHTDTTHERAKRLAAVIGRRVVLPLCKIPAYKVDEIKAGLCDYLNAQAWTRGSLVFNLTGGTKTMALAAYEVARQLGARAFYYQTENNESVIHPYRFEAGNLVCEAPLPIEATLTVDDYLRLYAGDYHDGKLKDPFEKMVEAALRAGLPEYEIKTSVKLIELAGSVEVDLLVRGGNQVAVVEVKRKAGKDGIDQLNGITDQRTLGTYTRKILVSAKPIDKNNLNLAKAYRITTVVVPSGQAAALTDEDARKLVDAVRSSLEPRPAQIQNPKSKIRDPK